MLPKIGEAGFHDVAWFVTKLADDGIIRMRLGLRGGYDFWVHWREFRRAAGVLCILWLPVILAISLEFTAFTHDVPRKITI